MLPHSTQIFWVFPLDYTTCIADVVAPRSERPKLIRVINFELVQPICPPYIGSAENAAVENAKVENLPPDDRGGKRRSGKRGSGMHFGRGVKE